MLLPSWIADRWRPPTLGEQGERAASRHLRRRGYKIVARRHRSRYGEFDLIAVDGREIVFVEVKTRRTDGEIRPIDSVGPERRRRMSRAAVAYLKSQGLLEYPARFDVIEVVWPAGVRQPTIRHHASAFPAEGRGQFFR
jgi:putative endonuclease